MSRRHAEHAAAAAQPRLDVCFLLEGTYPYVAGGVSSWVHQLVTGMPDLRFGYVHLGADKSRTPEPIYEVPDNVVVRHDVWLRDPTPHVGTWQRLGKRLRDAFGLMVHRLLEERADALDPLAGHLDELRRPGVIDGLLRCREGWQALRDHYRAEAGSESFLDYVWTWRFILEPMLKTLAVDVPDAPVYHSCCTGYSGALAGVIHESRRQVPVLLTEHGIYAKERRIEVHSAEWIRDATPLDVLPETRAPYFRDAWERHFRCLSRVCYAKSRRIYTLFARNGEEQVRDGADPDRIEVVPNGVRAGAFAAARERHDRRADDEPFTIGFAGRVTPIKDVRSLLAAVRLVVDRRPDTVCRILGPTEEDATYAEGCMQLADELGLRDHVRFEGRVDLRKEFADIDVVVLTSISEGQPLVILEAGAVGIPVVATDVGSCRELLEGHTDADRALGPGGLVTPIAAPGAIAAALLQFAEDPDLRRRMGQSLLRRVLEHYDLDALIDTYRHNYLELAREAQPWPESASNSAS